MTIRSHVGIGAAVVVAIGLMIGGTAVIRSSQDPGLVDRPSSSDPTPTTMPTPTTRQNDGRPIVYSDVTWPDGLMGDPIHVGDRTVDTGGGFVHMAVTDDGVVYASPHDDDNRLWFTDGGTPVQIASHACPSAHGWPGSIITGNSGSLVAWFDCTPKRDQQRPELVVFDTSSGHEVGRVPAIGCSTELQAVRHCTAIIGDRVYTQDRVYTSRKGALIPYGGMTTGHSFATDIRKNPRALVFGGSWDSGTPTLGGVFVTVGRRLVPFQDEHQTSAFDTATRRPVEFLLPPRYEPDSEPEASSPDGATYGLFEWLDDDTVALESSRTGRHDQDILTCRISTGSCELTVPSLGRDRAYRVVQNESLGDVQFDI